MFLPSSTSLYAFFFLSKLIAGVFSQTFLAYLDSVAAKCNYVDYLDEHVKYPPKGPLPLPGLSTEADPGCEVWSEIFNAALLLNPAFNVYRIFSMVRRSLWLCFREYLILFSQNILWDVLGVP